MTARGWGRVVNVTSLTVPGRRERASYSAVKAALVRLTRSWVLELATKGVPVNAVAPRTD